MLSVCTNGQQDFCNGTLAIIASQPYFTMMILHHALDNRQTQPCAACRCIAAPEKFFENMRRFIGGYSLTFVCDSQTHCCRICGCRNREMARPVGVSDCIIQNIFDDLKDCRAVCIDSWQRSRNIDIDVKA